MTLVWKKEAAVRDSIERIRKAEQEARDSIQLHNLIQSIRKSKPYRTGSSIYDDDTRKHRHKHPGTHPDDGMFNFDPWDDEDDAYDIERMMVETDPPSFK